MRAGWGIIRGASLCMWMWGRCGNGRLAGAARIRFRAIWTQKERLRVAPFVLRDPPAGCGDNGGVKSWVEISGARLVENLRAVQSIVNVGAGAEVLGVVKANAYGHDAAIVAPVLVNAGVRWLGVADVEEGARVRGVVGDGVRLLVMLGLEEADCKEVVEHDLTPVVWTVEHVAMLERAAESGGEGGAGAPGGGYRDGSARG